ncbi:MAG: class I SAM-dependent methyltransferase [Pseudomonadota bacterium]
MELDPTIYQVGYSKSFAEYQYDPSIRNQKAHKTLSVVMDHYGGAEPLKRLSLLDIGCSAGLMTVKYAEFFGRTVGVDIDEPAVSFARREFETDRLTFESADAMETGFDDGTFDVATCTHIYEHVPDARRLLQEIHRILKPGAVCYFVAQNRITIIEPHYFLPFLSMLPKPLAHIYYRLAGKGRRYYETLLTAGQLRRLVSSFEVIDYTERIIADPLSFSAEEMITPGSLKQKLALFVIRKAYFLCPTYVWLLRKGTGR